MPGPLLRDPGPLRTSLYDAPREELAPLQQEAEERAIESSPEHQALLASTKHVIPRPAPMPSGTPVFSSPEDFDYSQREAAAVADMTPFATTSSSSILRTSGGANPARGMLASLPHGSIPRTASFDFNTFANRLVRQESGGKADARNPRSTATGRYQFLDSTFINTVKKHMPNLAKDKTDKQILDLRSDDEISSKVFDSFSRENKGILDENNVPIDYGTMYAAHFAGAGKAAKLYSADPREPVTSYFSPAEIEANPHLKDMTVAEFWQWARGVMNR